MSDPSETALRRFAAAKTVADATLLQQLARESIQIAAILENPEFGTLVADALRSMADRLLAAAPIARADIEKWAAIFDSEIKRLVDMDFGGSYPADQK